MMQLQQNAEYQGAPSFKRDRFDRVSDIVGAAIAGSAGGAVLASAFGGGLTRAVIGAVLGFAVNAAVTWIYPLDGRSRVGVATGK